MNELKPYRLPQFQSAKAAAAAAAKAAAKNKKRYEQTQKQARKQQQQYSPSGFVSAGIPPSTVSPSPPSDYSFTAYSPRASTSSTSSLYEDDLRSVAATTTTNATTTAPSIRSSYSTYNYPSGVSSVTGIGISTPSAAGAPTPSFALSQAQNSNHVNMLSPNRAPKQDWSQQHLHHQQAFVLPQEHRGGHKSADRATQTDERDIRGAPPSRISDDDADFDFAPESHHPQNVTQHSPPGVRTSKIPHSLPSSTVAPSGVLPLALDSSDAPTAVSKSASTDTAREDNESFVLSDVRDDGSHDSSKHTPSHKHKNLTSLVGQVPLPLHHIPHHKHKDKDYRPEYINLTSASERTEDEEKQMSAEHKEEQEAKLSHSHSQQSTSTNHTHASSPDKHIQVHSLGVPESPAQKEASKAPAEVTTTSHTSPSPESTTVSPTNSVSPAYLSSLSSYNNDDEVAPEIKEDEFFDAEESVPAAAATNNTPEVATGYFTSRRPAHHAADEMAVDPLSVEDASSATDTGTGTDKTSIIDTVQGDDTGATSGTPTDTHITPGPASSSTATSSNTVKNPSAIASPAEGAAGAAGAHSIASALQSPPMTRRQTAPPTNMSVSPAASSLHPPHANHRPSLSFSRRRSVPVQTHGHNHPDCIQLLDENEQNEVNRLRDSIIAQREYKKKRREFVEDDKVLVGTKVSEGHDNYVTAYNMLTGLRVAVSRCNAKNDRPLTDEDFTARHKLAFDIVGNELTPSAKYDFKFKDYSPWVFRHLRELFKLDPADYLMSLTSKYIVSELGSPGKSGSFFYFSRDYRFIIKTIHHSEHKQLRKILKDYYNHVKANPNTLISQFYGLHRVKLPFGRKIHFIVMNNLFPPHRDIHRTFDLKGSSIGRELPVPLPTNEEEEAALAQGENLQNAAMVFKDINWIKAKQTINLGPTKREQFLKQLQVDVELLKRLNIMDYSLLIGIHDLKKGNTEGLRDNLLSVFQPVDSNNTSGKPDELRRVISATSPTAFNTQDMPYVVNEHSSLQFYADDGGFRSTNDEDEPLDEIYYLGIIDCLTPYGFVKRVETFWKSLKHPRFALSAIPSTEYGDRFFNFMKSVVKSPPAQEKPSRGRRLFNKLTKPIHSTSQNVSQGVHNITSPIFNQGNASSSSFQHHHNHQHLHQGHHFAGFSGYHTHSPQNSTATPVATTSSTTSATPVASASQRSSSIGSAAGVHRCNSLGAPGRSSSFGRTDSISSVTSTHTARSGQTGAANKPASKPASKPANKPANKPALNSMPPPASNKPLTRTSQDIDINVLPSLQEVETRAPSLKTELSRE
ncbi:Phosphatidylinositol 4-phosphate 5-kinase its3 [Yarrowia sp. E02]|nr:Phosphatidylinositol 4-phosphate 5-kinase its3 [Yarrowia sp. E02]